MNRFLKAVAFIERKRLGYNSRSKVSLTPRQATSTCLTSINLNQRELPKQPVPDLKSTADRYLRSVRPLLDDQEYSNTERIVKEFCEMNGVGEKLQRQLLERYEIMDSWMNEWFLHNAYLDCRDPIIVSSSPGTVGPEQKFCNLDEFCRFGARLIAALWEYNVAVKSGKIKQEMARDDPLDMQPYALILGTHRRPGNSSDTLLHTDDSKHIIILSNNHFFKLDIADINERLTLSERQFVAILKNVIEISKIPGKPVGILTGNFRDRWAEDYNRLKDIGKNAEILSDIENALFILCLDKPVNENLIGNKNIASIRALQSMTGFSSSTNSGNRWHDKAVQYIISGDGFVGMEYEHSPCEGVPVAVLHDHVLKSIAEKAANATNFSADDSIDFPKAKHLIFQLDESFENSIQDATKVVDKISSNVDMECFTFDEFGTASIKRVKQSPDSFIQTAMQLALYKVQGKPRAHYESAGLRRFRSTRTECIRSTSLESVNFARAMLRQKRNDDDDAGRKEAMVRAINAHKHIASEAATGRGVDRHLFGLKMIAKKNNIELPDIYKDIGFTRSTYFTLTSSQVPYKTASFMCYGPVVPDGYGCCYNPRERDILIACSAFESSEATCAKNFGDALKEALFDMMKLAKS